MTLEQVLSALLAFILGLLSKVLYDVWSERRRKKSLLFTKSTLSSFSIGRLEKDLREQLEVLYQGRPLKSIHLFEVGVENDGYAVVRNQAVTVEFDENAVILGQPESDSSPEDLRYVHQDSSVSSPNKSRFIIDLLQKGRSIAWRFVVIDQQDEDFNIHPGLAEKDAEEVDFDVDTSFTQERIRLNLADRIRRLVYLVIGVSALSVLRGVFIRQTQELAVPIINMLIIALLLWIGDQAASIVLPLMNWIREVISDSDKPSELVFSSSPGAVVGSGNSVKVVAALEEELRDMLLSRE
jgi:hypothetical protein